MVINVSSDNILNKKTRCWLFNSIDWRLCFVLFGVVLPIEVKLGDVTIKYHL